MKTINWILQDWGYESRGDFFQSTFHFHSMKSIFLVSFTTGIFSTIIKDYIGLEPIVYLSFIALLVMEFYTGIQASLKEKKKIQSKKFGRFIFKIATYTIMISIVNIFKNHLKVPQIFGFEIDVYSFIFYTILNLIIMQLIISVFENFSRLGFKESSKIYNRIESLMSKWFYLDDDNKESKKSDDKEEEDKDPADKNGADDNNNPTI